MPAALERALRRSARARGIDPDSARGHAYVYGTLRKIEAARKRKAAAAARKRTRKAKGHR